METGGYHANFIDEPADYLKCIVCTLVLRNPILFVDCGHRVCKNCFDRMKEDATQRTLNILCPHDRIEIVTDKVFEDKGISRVILDFKVKCNNFSDGCGWVGELRDLQKHLDDSCGYEEKHNLMKLMKQLMKRMEDGENKLNEKDEEIAKLRNKNDEHIAKLLRNEKDEQIAKLRNENLVKRMEDCEKKLNEKDEEIAKLKDNVLVSNDKIKNLQQQVDELTKKVSTESDKAENLDTKKKSVSLTENQPTPNQYSDQIKLLQEHLMNVDVYVPSVHTEFTWKLLDYSDHANKRRDVFSPKFYSRLKGHYCMLSLSWCDIRRGHFDVYFHLCKGVYGELVTDEFDMDMRIESYAKDGQKFVKFIPRDDIYENSDFYAIKYDEWKSKGLGFYDFFNKSALKNFIIDNVLTITCTLLETSE